MRRPLRSAILDPHAVSVSGATLDGPPYRGAGTATATTALPLGVQPKPGHRFTYRLAATTVDGTGGRVDHHVVDATKVADLLRDSKSAAFAGHPADVKDGGTGEHAGRVLQHEEPLRGWKWLVRVCDLALGRAGRLRLPRSGAGAEITTRWSAYQLPDESRLKTVLLTAACQAGLSPEAKVAGPSNIGSYLAGLGIQATAGFGVEHHGLHSTDERIRIDSIPPVQAAYHQACLTLLNPF
jgi:hypothetical protein